MKKGEALLDFINEAIAIGIKSLSFVLESNSDEDTASIVAVCGKLNTMCITSYPVLESVNLDFDYKAEKAGGVVRPVVEGYITFRSGEKKDG